MKLTPRSTRWLLAALAGVFMTGCASVTREAAPTTPDRPKPGKGLVTFYRESSIVGMAVGFNVRDNDRRIGGLPNGTYFVYDAAPGTHIFSAATEATSELSLTVQPGQSYYVRGALRMGAVVGRPHLSIVDPAEGADEVRSLRRVKLSE